MRVKQFPRSVLGVFSSVKFPSEKCGRKWSEIPMMFRVSFKKKKALFLKGLWVFNF